MAGSSTTTRSVLLLLLLPFFISFHQTSANPLCDAACKDVGVKEFMINLKGLEQLKVKCPGIYNLESSLLSTLHHPPTAEKTCDFPGNFSRGVRNLRSLALTKCNLQDNDVTVKHLEHLEVRLNITNKCPVLVDLYCNRTMRCAPITSLEGFLNDLTNVLQQYQSLRDPCRTTGDRNFSEC